MNKESRIFVSGANGLLGTNIIIELLNLGFYVTGFLRNKNSFVGRFHENLCLVEGNLSSKNDLDNAMINCEYVIHTAAITNPKLIEYNEYEEVNVLGTKNIIQTAIKNDVKRVVYVSTATVFGFGTLNNLGNESNPIKYPFNKSHYSKSKKEAQDYVLAKKTEIDIVVVNPTFIIGAYDSKPSSGKIIQMALQNKIVLCPPGGKNFVSVKDVSKGIIKVLKKGINGEAYLLTNQNMTFKNFFKLIRKRTKRKFVILQLPKFVLLMLGYTGSVIRYFGIKTHFSIENMKTICLNTYYSNNKSKNQLGLTFYPIENAIDEAVDWFAKR